MNHIDDLVTNGNVHIGPHSEDTPLTRELKRAARLAYSQLVRYRKSTYAAALGRDYRPDTDRDTRTDVHQAAAAHTDPKVRYLADQWKTRHKQLDAALTLLEHPVEPSEGGLI